MLLISIGYYYHLCFVIIVAPISPPLSLLISNVSASGFLLSWSDPPLSDQNGVVRSYEVNITEENTANQFQLISFSKSQWVASLHPFYNYSCIVSAVTVEAGPYSEPITVTTSEDSTYAYLVE